MTEHEEGKKVTLLTGSVSGSKRSRKERAAMTLSLPRPASHSLCIYMVTH